jgi:Dolichyl-phosphate-mannose-protein mannosyltransferase
VRARLTAWAWVTLVALFIVLSLSLTHWHLEMTARLIGEPRELEYGEAIVYAHASRLMRGEPLYQPLDHPPYTVVAYTPFYYGIAAGLQAAFGPGFVAGRIVSCLAGLSIVVLVARITARAAGDVRPGLVAILLFVALGFPGRPPWYALYKEDLLGVALSLATIALLLLGGTARSRLVLAGVLAGLAFLTKQTFLAAFLAGAIWLWIRDRPRAGVFVASWVILVAGAVATCELLMPGFLANTVLGNIVPFNRDALLNNLRLFVTFIGGPVAVAAGYVMIRIGKVGAHGADLRVLYWAATFLPLVGLAKIGSNHNYWIETAASSAVLASLGIWEARRRWLDRGDVRALLPIVVLLGSAVSVMRFFEAPVLPVLSGAPSKSEDQTAAFHQVVERVRSEPGPVLADPLDVVALAGREIEFEPYLFSVLSSEGRWDPGPLIGRICAREIGLVVFGNALETPGFTYQGYAFWPAPILAALRETMVLDSERAGRFLYIPAPITSADRPPPERSGVGGACALERFAAVSPDPAAPSVGALD